VTNSCYFRQHLSAEQPGFGGQTASLVVRETKPPGAELGTKDSVFLAQILNRVLLRLMDPPGNSNQQKAKRVQRIRHRFSSLSFPLGASICRDSACLQAVPVSGYYAVPEHYQIRKWC
jgi:hypothetical protein